MAVIRRRGRNAPDVPSTICSMPWLNLSLDVDGSSRPCCKFSHLEAGSDYPMASLRDTDLEGVWQSPAMQKLRRDFRAGVQPAECSTCWDEEAAGIRSWRQTFTEDRHVSADIDFDDPAPPAPVALDLKLSNACNLKCRICGPVASSLWLTEELRNAAEPESANVVFLRNSKRYFLSSKIMGSEANLATLRSWLPGLQHVEMTGGEPMFSAENREVIDLIATEGDPGQVSLLLTTNATVVDDRILAHLPEFQAVAITLSLDDIDERLEYERTPSRWAEVQANIDRYLSMASSTVTVRVNCSVSTLNAYYLPEILGWFEANIGQRRLPVHLNLVHGPDHYRVQNLPEPLKAEVRTRLAAAAGNRSLHAEVRSEVQGVIEFMDGEAPDPAAWAAFVHTTIDRDRVRDQHFDQVFPEYHAAISRLGLWQQDAPTRSIGSAVRWLGRRVRAGTA